MYITVLYLYNAAIYLYMVGMYRELSFISTILGPNTGAFFCSTGTMPLFYMHDSDLVRYTAAKQVYLEAISGQLQVQYWYFAVNYNAVSVKSVAEIGRKYSLKTFLIEMQED